MALGVVIIYTNADGEQVFSQKCAPADVGSDLDPQDHSAENRAAFEGYVATLTPSYEIVDKHKPEGGPG